MGRAVDDNGRGVSWVALILSFIGAAFVGPAVGAGIALLITAVVAIAFGDSSIADTVGTTLTLAGSGVLFLAAWLVLYRLVKRIFD